MKNYLFVAALFFFAFNCISQGETDQQLAQYYFNNGDFEKAQLYYSKIYENDPSKFNFNRYFECLIQTNNDKEAEKLLKKQISSNKSEPEYKVSLGIFYEDHNEIEKAQRIYSELIDDLPPDAAKIIALYTVFKNKTRYDLAMSVLENGRKLLKDYPFHFQFAEVYGATGQTEKMITEYLNLLDYNTGYGSSVQSILSRRIDFTAQESKEYDLLKSSLLERIQKKPNEPVYTEMLVWLFIQKKNFTGALAQVQSLDKRLDEQGKRVLDFGRICVENKDYETARKAFKYITLLGEDKQYYYQAESALLNTRFLEVTSNRNYSNEEILATINEYQTTLSRVGNKRTAVNLIIELSHIQAFYGDQSDLAIQNLNEALKIAGITDIQKAEIKMQLADIQVMHGDIWEASLLYMQVENDFKFEPIGHEAKFKNARIFYYDGEFDFAQSQLSVLKESTSKLIANDALKLSLLITDNFGLDSNYVAMSQFAAADLLIQQHKYSEAFVLFDSIVKAFPYHSLGDEILFRKATAMEMQGNWSSAISYLDELLKYYKEDILADDAVFMLGDIYENHLKNNEKAMEYYKTVLFDFKGSLHSVEARKRLRTIRGDSVSNEDETL